jgi:RND family efflux transporter MFP subunit
LGTEIEGFTEPYRTVNVGATEVGIVSEIKVREGDRITKGQTLATLDQDVHLALLAIAAASMDSTGRLDSAKAELDLRRVKLAKLEQLGARGHARQEEVERARADVAIAAANVRAVEEDLLIRRLEYDKIRAQHRRRTVRAPIDGIVAQVHKEVGEPIAPNDPQVLMLVQLTKLRATFSVPREDAAHVRVNNPVTIRFAPSNIEAKGVVEFVSPTIDAESGTVRIKVRIDNPSERYPSGARCTMVVPNHYRDVAASK